MVLPLLRAALPGVAVVSVVPDVDYRTFPMVSLRRDGGTRSASMPRRFAHPVMELAAVSADGPIEAEELYDDALDALYDAVRRQITVEGVGYLQSISEAQGPSQAPSRYPDTWAVEGKLRLSVRSSAV